MTSSVTGCSTWSRAFSSRKQKRSPSRMNSAVPAPRSRALARARRPPSPIASRRLDVERGGRGTPRAPSGGGAGWSSRARRGGRRCRACRRAAASRRAAGARRSARRRPSRLRILPSPRGCAASSASSSSSGERTTRIPRPPPPAAALTISGKPTSSGAPDWSTGTPASRGEPLGLELVAGCADGPLAAGRPRRARPLHGLGEVARSRPGSRSPGGSRRRRSRLAARDDAPPGRGST